MPIAAVPRYLEADFSQASPGLRFGMLLPIWTSRSDQEREVRERAARQSDEGRAIAEMLRRQGMDATIKELCQRKKNPLPFLWKKNDSGARKSWDVIRRLNEGQRALMQALVERQRASASQMHGCVRIPAKAIAPFTTGLGNAHPLENGFAFLWPYGLPYLAGSGVKGVVRRAAQELAHGMWENSRGWSKLGDPCFTIEYRSGKEKRAVGLSVIDVLFGREPPPGDSDAVRGALSFWDAIPQIEGDSLMVEIMTPHQSHYYQERREPRSGNSSSPHDSGQPTPICFLTVPPGSAFTFYVVCDERHLARLTASPNGADAPKLLEEGDSHWKRLVGAAFEHAFEWLGFGAKTAVGYGAMAKAETAAPARGASASDADRARSSVWEDAKLVWNPGSQELVAVKGTERTAPVKGRDAARGLFSDPAQFERLTNRRELAKVRVEVRVEGNMRTLVRVLG